VGALGANLAEQLVRAGVVRLALLDGDVVTAGNVCRHPATLVDVGKSKVRSVAERLLQISPAVEVAEIGRNLGGDQRALVEALEPFDVLIDCTASDEALVLLAEGWWPIPRVFASFSMGFGAKRVFSFGVTGHKFPQQKFSAEVEPWLNDEAATWASEEEVVEGAGCWSPLFPARNDDVVMAAAICVKEIETLAGQRPRDPRFRVFEKRESTAGFLGFSVRETPSVSAVAT
jgi:molybdopterin/thiamine biosynthesis adenylyltransferase